MNKLFLLIIGLIVIFGCETTPKHMQIADEFMSSFKNEMCTSKGLYAFGSGGSFLDAINEYSFYFISFEEVDLNMARKKLVETTETLLNEINSDEKMRPYLSRFPFTCKDVDVIISFRKLRDSNQYVDAPNIALAFNGGGGYGSNALVYYSIYDSCKDDLVRVHNESYCRARGILEHQGFLLQFPTE